jgi:hypothetical protein
MILKGIRMTNYHKQQAEIRYSIDGRICQVCGQSLTSFFGAGLAHRIPKTKINIRKFTEKIINHNCNLVPTCMDCNSKVLIDNKPTRKIHLIGLISSRGNELFTTKEINRMIGVCYD